MRTDHEVLLVVHRPRAEFLVLLRSLGGFWHLVSGGVEDDEAPEDAAWRELSEETGLVPDAVTPVPLELGYRTSKGACITVHAFAAAAPAGWEPVLDHEHLEYRWCSEEAALAILRYPEPRDALSHVARTLELPA